MVMGYTHYWGFEQKVDCIPVEKWSGIRREAEVLTNAFPKDAIADVRIDAEMIVISGGAETFCLSRVGHDRGICKTQHAAYDKLVCAILTITAQRCRSFRIMSDAFMGEEPDGWPEAFIWASQVLGREVGLPVDGVEIPADPPRTSRMWSWVGAKLKLG
jgi:hypothetical protein